jgi:hypothetical protein
MLVAGLVLRRFEEQYPTKMLAPAYAPAETKPQRAAPESHMLFLNSEEAVEFPQIQAEGSLESQE